MILVACDPGLQGAFCFDDTKSGAFDVYDMPTLEKPLAKRSKKTRTIYNIAEVYALLDTFKGLGTCTSRKARGLSEML